MPRSRHHKKNMSASKWRKISNIRKALRKYVQSNPGDVPDWFIEHHYSNTGKYKKKINVSSKTKKSKYRKVSV